jgi:ABC-type uncharacterized transport system fused permease/ATPase subunit
VHLSFEPSALLQDRAAFIRLIGVSVLQSGASSILAPSLRHVGDALALAWRRRLTQAAHAYYLRGNNFYAVSQLAGMQVRSALPSDRRADQAIGIIDRRADQIDRWTGTSQSTVRSNPWPASLSGSVLRVFSVSLNPKP